jgi:hypothetical protein
MSNKKKTNLNHSSEIWNLSKSGSLRKYEHIPEFTSVLIVGTPTFSSAPSEAGKCIQQLGYQGLLQL